MICVLLNKIKLPELKVAVNDQKNYLFNDRRK